ncbi:MAG TPA: efflux transporter outer membrane subunit, partial [Acetobacteraceae bacterium]|nr:efflux transporter outer membrane subunit [Acetobacteraceae bacterium]
MKQLAPLCLALLAAGCMVGPDYHRPVAQMPVQYKELAGWVPAHPADLDSKGAWWQLYNDPLLNQLESRVALSNQNVKSYYAQFQEAREVVREAQAQLYPVLGATAGLTRQGFGSGSGGVGTTVTGATGGRSGGAATTYTLQGTASWDLDVWGRIRRQIESNVAAAQVSAADLQNATLSAQGTLATDYMQLRYQDSLQDLLQATVRAYAAALRITSNQVAAGTTTPADEAAAETQLDSARASLINVGVARGQYEHAIAVLAGMAPADLTIPHAPLAGTVPVPPPGLPATLLQRRPDIAAAERAMEEENALIGVQVAAYYPDISLSASYGWESTVFDKLISAASRVWSLGASASETIFEGGARSAAVAAARDAYDASVANYRQTVLTGLQQVEDELVALRILAQQAAAEDVAVRAAQRSVRIALNEYRAGTQAYTAVITEQTALFSDQQAALSVQAQ